jgi:hypothetical protein
MSKTSRRTWQIAEGRAAGLFGCRRQPLSGSSGRDDVGSTSDSTHETLFLESKFRHRHAVRALHDAVKKRAAKEKKVPILALHDKGRPGFLLVIHSDDFLAATAAYIAALGVEERDRLDALIADTLSRITRQEENP